MVAWCDSVAHRLRIAAVDERPLIEVHYLNAGPRGGTVVERLPIVRASIGALPGELDAIGTCSDLQGIVPGRDGLATLLGVAVAEALDELVFDGVLPPTMRTGVLLAGDLYAVPEANKRGGYGDVAEVWAAFAEPRQGRDHRGALRMAASAAVAAQSGLASRCKARHSLGQPRPTPAWPWPCTTGS
jgi:hypothetical protein